MLKISKKVKRYLELAKRNALQSSSKHKHGSVLVKSGSVINTAYNKKSYNSFISRFQKKERDFGTCCHAEIQVILGIEKVVTQGSIIYVTRIDKNNNMTLSKPCDLCVDVCKFVGIRKIIYSISNNYMGVIKL